MTRTYSREITLNPYEVTAEERWETYEDEDGKERWMVVIRNKDGRTGKLAERIDIPHRAVPDEILEQKIETIENGIETHKHRLNGLKRSIEESEENLAQLNAALDSN